MTNSRHPRINIVIKKADETVNSSTAQQNDDELFATLLANKRYIIEIRLLIKCHATPDIKYSSTLPSGATGKWTVSTWSSLVPNASAVHTTGINANTTDVEEWIYNSLSVVTGATAGLFNLTWAQNSSSSEDTKVLAGSSIVVHEQ